MQSAKRFKFGQPPRLDQLQDHDAIPLPAISPGENYKNIGVYMWDRNPAGAMGFEKWVGLPVNIAEDFQPFYGGWELMISDARAPYWTEWVKAVETRRVAFAFPVFPAFRDTWEPGAGDYDGARGQTTRALEYFQAAANGEFNHYYRQFGQMLINNGLKNSIIRFGHEFDGNWYAWSISVGPGGGTEKARLYAAAFRQLVTTLRSLSGQNFTFSWNPNAAYTTDPNLLRSAWPGKEYVDYISFDQYDQFYGGEHYNEAYHAGTPQFRREKQEAVWNHIYNHPTGLKWFGAFSREMDVPLTIGEWGLWYPEPGHEHRGGGDNAYFIRRMYNYINENNVAWHVYFNFGDVSHSIYNTHQHPMASREFLRLWHPNGAPEHYPYSFHQGLPWQEAPRHMPPAISPDDIEVPQGATRYVLPAYEGELIGRAKPQPDPWSLCGTLAELWREPEPDGTAIILKSPVNANGFALVFQAWVQSVDHFPGGNDRFVNVYVNDRCIATNHRLPAVGRGWIDSYGSTVFENVEIKEGDEISFHIPAGVHNPNLWSGVMFDYVMLLLRA